MSTVITSSRPRIGFPLCFVTDGGIDPTEEDWQLPDFELVSQDVASVPDIRNIMSMIPEKLKFLLHWQDATTGERVAALVPRSLIFYIKFRHLFNYSFLVNIDGVPRDIVKTVAWALEMPVDVFTNCSDAQLASAAPIADIVDSIGRATLSQMSLSIRTFRRRKTWRCFF
ncbi:hypothetical protein DAEQUDRAFT_723099, partial [Daedalea quercina L-15889]